MIVLVGASASGKSTLADLLVQHDNKYHKVVTYTTRPMRDGEQDGIDYHFVNDEEFEKLTAENFFIETAVYRDWHYGTPRDACDDKNAVIVMNPVGMRSIKREGISNVIFVYLYVDRESRMIQSIYRGDNVDEAYRRNLTDVGHFGGVEDEADYIIDNTQYHMNREQTLSCLLEIIKVAESKNGE